MKKTLLVASSLVLLTLPVVTVSADSFDQKIQQQNEKINDIKNESTSLESLKRSTEAEIQSIEGEIQAILQKKTATEEEVNALAQEIQVLEEKIIKRTEVLANQARDIQTSEPSNRLFQKIVDAESIGEAIQRAIASVTIMNASNSIVEQQQEDIATSQKLEKELQEQLVAIEEQSNALQGKQAELADVKLNQEVALADLALALNTEEEKKDQLEADKAEAQRQKEAALKQLAEQEAQEAKARKEAEEAAKRQQAAEAAKRQQAAEAAKRQQAAEAKSAETAESPAVQQAAVAAAQPKTEAAVAPETSVSSEKTAATPAPVQQAAEPKEQASTGGWQMPVDSVHISSRFGYRTDPTGASGNQHNGIDFTGGTGTPIYAIQAGEVVEAGYGPSTGNYVIIKHANGVYSYYMHFSTLPAVSVGQSVSARQYVGGMGTTGNSTGVHLHLGMSTSLWSGFFDPAPELGL